MPCGACGCACSEAPREELTAPLLMDIETGPGHIMAAAPPDGEVDEPTDAEMDKAELIFCCVVRGLLALLWLYLVDLMRRTIPTDDGDYHQYHVLYVGFFAALLGMFFCEFCVNVSAPPNLARRRVSS